MRTIQRLTTAFALALAGAALACGGGSSPTTPTITTTTTTTTPTPTPVATTRVKYEGTFAAAAYIGSFTISADIPVSLVTSVGVARPSATSAATCTYHFAGAANTNSVTGTYDSATKTFVCANSAISMTATIQSDNTVTGTTKAGTTPEGGMAGAVTTSSTSALNLCGSFTGGDSNGGRISMTQTGEKLTGVAYDNGTNSRSYPTGTVVGALVKFTWPLEAGNSGSGSGVLTAGANTYFINGNWTNTFGEKGTWTVSASSC